MDQTEESNKLKLKMWSSEEDKVLVECLVTLRMEQKFMADNGFKPGFANALQAMMEEKLPGCGIKACPHITSRIKTLKRLWQAAYDMVYGNNTSGFGWDPEKKIVTAEKEVWDEYVKVHPKSGQFRTKSFPNFENLCFVWAKDRAVGEEGISPGAMEEDVNVEVDDLPESPHIVGAEVDLSQTMGETPPNTTHINDTSSSQRKKRKVNNSEVIAEVLRETVTSLDKTILHVFEKLGNQLSGQERQAQLDAKGADLFMEIVQLEGLSQSEKNAAHIKIVGSEQLLNAFGQIPMVYKASWIRSLLEK